MPIFFDESSKTFNLFSKEMQYTMYVDQNGRLCHAYWGKKIRALNVQRISNSYKMSYGPNLSLEILPQEYPAYGGTDFRSPAYQVQFEDGSTVSDLKYTGHKIYKGKPKLDGLPSTYVESEDESQTLEVYLYDAVGKLSVTLTYTVFENFQAIARSAKFKNESSKKIKILRALSANVDFEDDDFVMIQLSGAWARERNIVKRHLVPGIQSIESRRGASSHQQNPFIALARKHTDEWEGEVYGFSLVYSGNFLAQVEVGQYETARVSMGINPFDFSWLLEPLETFQTPEIVMTYSSEGFNGMSQTYHKLYASRLARGKYRDVERPILVNNWEATYFNFNEEKLLKIAKEAKELGIELFVLDDGWFGKRDADNSSLGDWVVDRRKLPNGLDGLAKKINEIGLKFGLWIEPEMVSPDSDLYRSHPDWCIHVNGRERNLSRNQLVLDFSRQDVCDYMTKTISDLLKSANISYVKWDMNRNMTEIGSDKLPPERQRETAHRYMLGLYKVMDEITSSFPDILFESCAGGGGRFDPGMLYYMPQAWTSDDTDAIERLKIQYGTSYVYPQVMMGSHVSAVPNHQVGRITPIDIRAHVAMSANMGFELDLTKISDEERGKIKAYVSEYKKLRKLIQFGNFYRLISPFEGNESAWMIIDEEQDEFLLYHFKIFERPNSKGIRIKLKGISTDKNYRLEGTNEIYGGDELLYEGITIPHAFGDFQSVLMHFKSV